MDQHDINPEITGTAKFQFDTVFAENGDILRTHEGARTMFTIDEVEEACEDAYQEGEDSEIAKAKRNTAKALKTIADSVQAIVPTLDRESGSLKHEAVDLALAAARVAADRCLQLFPLDTVTQLFAEAAEHLRSAPQIQIKIPEGKDEALLAALEGMIREHNLEGKIQVLPDPEAQPGDCAIVWQTGAILHKQDEAISALRAAAERWLQHQTDPGPTPGPSEDGAVQLSLFDHV